MDSETDEDHERLEFRKQLSELTFEQLIELKQKVGTKIFNESVQGKDSKVKTEFSRTHKNRPREMSSKIPVNPLRIGPPPIILPKQNKEVLRDPRFDSHCGEFNEKVFNKSYGFIKEIRTNEKVKLLKELNKETDDEKKKNIRYLIRRIENKEREERRKSSKEEAETAEQAARKQAVKDGKKPYFYKKSDKKLIDLVDSYEPLKKSGKLMKHIKRKYKKAKGKDHKMKNKIK